MPNPDPQSPPTTVLVVDDEDGIRQALDRFLTRLGYRVLQAASGAEALDRQAAEQPQVMLSDIRMPNLSGVELVPKALAADSDLAIIMLTAIDEPRTAIECLKLGAYDYLIKPVDRDELEMSLQSGLRQRQLEIDRREHTRSGGADDRGRGRRAHGVGGRGRLAGGERRNRETSEGAGHLARRRDARGPEAAVEELGFLGRFGFLFTRFAACDAAE